MLLGREARFAARAFVMCWCTWFFRCNGSSLVGAIVGEAWVCNACWAEGLPCLAIGRQGSCCICGAEQAQIHIVHIDLCKVNISVESNHDHQAYRHELLKLVAQGNQKCLQSQ